MTRNDRYADEQAIRAAIGQQVAGWDAGDAEGYASVFTSDADYVTFLGGHYQRREAIAQSYVPLFETFLKGSQLDLGVPRVRFVASDVALIYSEYAVVKGRRRLNSGVNTTVAVRTDPGWFFAASQNTKHRRFAERLLPVFSFRKMSSFAPDH